MTDLIDPSSFTAYFAKLGEVQGTAGPIGELTAHLAKGQTTPAGLQDVYERHDRASEPWFLAQRIDLFLGYVQYCLDVDGRLTLAHVNDLRVLHTLLRIPEDACVKVRPVEVATILRQQIEDILSDAVIDDSEDLYQVELQALFGLGYDEYLRMTRIVFERVWAELRREARSGSRHATDAVYAKIAALEPVVKMALAQPRSLGALYT